MDSYSFNKTRFAVGLLAFLWLAWATVQDNRELKVNRHEVGIEFLLTVAVAGVLVWLATVRLRLTRHGLTYKSLTGTRQMQWKDVAQFYVSWRQRYLARLIPWYRAFRIQVVDRHGASIVFGNRFQGIAELAERVGEVATEQLAPRQLAEFKAGRPIDFGAVTVSQKGIQVHDDRTVGWPDVVSYELTESELGIATRLGPPIILPLRRLSMPGVCAALIAEGVGSVRKAG